MIFSHQPNLLLAGEKLQSNQIMGSFTEEQLVQMVRDYHESDSSVPPPYSLSFSKPISPSLQSNTYLSLQEIIWRAPDCEIEILEKVLMYLKNTESVMEPKNLKNKWVVMKLKEDGYDASLCTTSWVSSFKLPKGCYEYVDVMVKEKNNVNGTEKVTRLIVDLDFRSQFELARPTQYYKQLKDTLPTIFVGTEEKLDKIVSLVCSAGKLSLKENGLHVPPWRKARYMQSKWLSKDCKKV